MYLSKFILWPDEQKNYGLRISLLIRFSLLGTILKQNLFTACTPYIFLLECAYIVHKGNLVLFTIYSRNCTTIFKKSGSAIQKNCAERWKALMEGDLIADNRPRVHVVLQRCQQIISGFRLCVSDKEKTLEHAWPQPLPPPLPTSPQVKYCTVYADKKDNQIFLI